MIYYKYKPLNYFVLTTAKDGTLDLLIIMDLIYTLATSCFRFWNDDLSKVHIEINTTQLEMVGSLDINTLAYLSKMPGN